MRFWFVCLLIGASGCAQTVSIRQLRPARVNLDLETLLILAEPADRPEAITARDALHASLSQANSFRLVQVEQLQGATPLLLRRPDGSFDSARVLDAARQHAIDGILLLRIDETRREDGSTAPSDRLVMQYQVLELPHGNLLEHNSVRSDVIPRNEPSSQLTAATQCAQLVAQDLVPYEVEIEVPLASRMWGKGTTLIRKGNAAARAGDWNEARRQWRAALEANPEDHVAWYNLSVGFEAGQHYTQAREAMRRATAYTAETMYEQNSIRMREAAHAHRIASAQRSARSRQPLGSWMAPPSLAAPMLPAPAPPGGSFGTLHPWQPVSGPANELYIDLPVGPPTPPLETNSYEFRP